MNHYKKKSKIEALISDCCGSQIIKYTSSQTKEEKQICRQCTKECEPKKAE